MNNSYNYFENIIDNLTILIKHNEIQKFQQFIEKINLNEQDQLGKTLLMHLIINNIIDYNFAKLLLNTYKINLNLQDNLGNTCLMYAIISYNLYLVKLLIAAGANLNLQNKQNKTALILASELNKDKIKERSDANFLDNELIMEMLLMAGADFNIINNNNILYSYDKNNIYLIDNYIKCVKPEFCKIYFERKEYFTHNLLFDENLFKIIFDYAFLKIIY